MSTPTLLATQTIRIYSDGSAAQFETSWADTANGPASEAQAEQLADALQSALNTLQKQRASRYFEDKPIGGANAHLLPYVEPVMQSTQRPNRPAPASLPGTSPAPAGSPGSAGTVVGQAGVGFPPGHTVNGISPLPANATPEQISAYNADVAARSKANLEAQAAAKTAGAPAVAAAQARDSTTAAANSQAQPVQVHPATQAQPAATVI